MFGILVAGQIPQTEGQVVGDNQMVFTIPQQHNNNNSGSSTSIAVFLTGLRPLDPTMAASIYLVGNGDWAFLGCINNSKPSAIFRVKDLNQQIEWRIGINVESENQAAQRISDKTVQNLTLNEEISVFTEKMCLNLYNYLTSFITADNTVSVKVLERWFENFKQKLSMDPNFWRR